MYTRWARCAPVPVMTNTRPTFRPTAASFSPATHSPTPRSSANDFPLLRQGSRDAEREVQVHPKRFRDIRHVGRGPPFQVPQDGGSGLRLGPLLHDDDTSFPELVHVALHGPLHKFGPRAHSRAPNKRIDLLEHLSRQPQGNRGFAVG